ncbi:adenylosuccinate synthase [Halolamina sp.]|jgi:adenylosuccinate synthase|uniref:adenylosuccinate synthase n=1 Tax=Halolamina sp. TaxID=1940283 RepID=UPI000223BD0F|nr:Adenylosuccinate synthetase [halophilic archaeon DL31]
MTVIIVGAQLGDEGKGALVDRWGGEADIVVRYQGGDNAGHTVVEGGEEYKLSLVPSGSVRGKTGVLGNGCVVNPRTLFEEIEALQEQGLEPDVCVAKRAHVIMPYHRVFDTIEEADKDESGSGEKVGTTGRGIGPTYEDKAGRRGVRIGDLLDPEVLRERLEYAVPQKRAIAEEVFGVDTGVEFDVDQLVTEYADYGQRLREGGMAVEAGEFLYEHRNEGANLLFEGAQGTSIDIDHGNYPYVTSSNPTAGGAAVGSGVGPKVLGQGEIVGIVKAYLSRVGEGPLPTEMTDEEEDLADYIREKGGEFGTVTGRPRRIGWLDVPMLRHAARRSSFTGIAVNHVDVLAGLDELKVCHQYDLDGETRETVPAGSEEWEACEPEFKAFDTWEEQDWNAVASEGYEALPEATREYLGYLEQELDAPVYAVGVGPDRDQTVERETPW